MAYWVSTENYSSPTLDSNLIFPGDANKTALNKSFLPNLIHLAGFSKLTLSETDEKISYGDTRYSCSITTINDPDLITNKPWPGLTIYINKEAMREKWVSSKNGEQRYANQLNGIIKKALLAEGTKENSADLSFTLLDFIFLANLFNIYSAELQKIDHGNIPTWIPAVLMTYLLELSLSNSVRGFLAGDKSPKFGAKESLFFGTKFDRIIWLAVQLSIAKLATPAKDVTVHR